MDHAQHNALVNYIWGIADDVLRDLYVRGKYRDVILPMTVLRRLDAVLGRAPSQETQTYVANVQQRWADLGGYTCNEKVLSSEKFRKATPYNEAFYQSMLMVKDFWATPEYAELLDQMNKRMHPFITGNKGTAEEALNRTRLSTITAKPSRCWIPSCGWLRDSRIRPPHSSNSATGSTVCWRS